MEILRLNEGAIVVFTLIGSAQPVNVVGKVVSVFPDEVQVVPQLKVYRKSKTPGYDYDMLDCTVTADSDDVIHVNRLFIQKWRYAKVTDADGGSISESGGIPTFLCPTQEVTPFSSYTFNHFDSDGFCRGSGKYCGTVKANYPCIIFNVPAASENDDGLVLEISP